MFDAASLLDQDGSRGRLGDEREGTILIDRDDDRDDQASLILGAIVEFLAESGDVHAVLTKRGADRRCGRGLGGGNLQLNQRSNFLCHKGILLYMYVVKRSAYSDPPTP